MAIVVTSKMMADNKVASFINSQIEGLLEHAPRSTFTIRAQLDLKEPQYITNMKLIETSLVATYDEAVSRALKAVHDDGKSSPVKTREEIELFAYKQVTALIAAAPRGTISLKHSGSPRIDEDRAKFVKMFTDTFLQGVVDAKCQVVVINKR